MPWNMVDSCSQLRLEIVWDKSSGLNWIWGIKTQNSSSIWLKVFTAATRYMILEGYFVSYFQKILEGSNSEMVLDSSMLSGALPIISSSKHMYWLSPITDEEIKKTLFSLKDNKAPGLDGFSVGFFKKSWSIVGLDTINASRSFFSRGRLLKQVNATTIHLIPKVPNPSKIKYFRPISCCNTIYKCIAKLIANRIKGVLSDLVGLSNLLLLWGEILVIISYFLKSFFI